MVVLYSTGCPRCEILKEKLQNKGIFFDVVEDKEKIVTMGFTSVPVLIVDGVIMDFREAVNWANAYVGE